jgi:Malectin domain
MTPTGQKDGIGTHLLYVGFLTILSFVIYSEIFTYNTFGPETAMFYYENDGHPFDLMLRSYTYFSLMWYRPTGFALPYWAIQQFVGWHNLVAWKFIHFWTVLAAAYAIYWLVVRCLGGSRMAALLSATYFMAQPSLYAAVMEVAGFDFLHILLTVVCAGLYILGTRAAGLRCALLTFAAWVLFVIAITAKEMALATPGYLLTAGLILWWFDRERRPLARHLRREALRLIPFFSMLAVYYFVHTARIPAGTFQTGGAYRVSANWDAILFNLRKLPLWIARIYAGSEPVKMYQSNLWNDLTGIVLLVIVIWQWRRLVRMNRKALPVLLLMLAWTAIFLILPVYAGGYIWHINLTVVGYSVLFGFAMAALLGSIQVPAARWAAAAVFFAGCVLLSRQDLKTELYSGVHAMGFRVNQSVLAHPPVPADALGKTPLIYIEDRLGLGPWAYGCFGRLFAFTYLRKDLKEIIVPAMSNVSRGERDQWMAHDNAFYFVYDENYTWHDATAEFRAMCQRGGMTPSAESCSAASGQGAQEPIRVAAGRMVKWTDRSGVVWNADSNFDSGKVYASAKRVTGTATPELFQNERFNDAPFEYRFCVKNGEYQVALKFAEVWFNAPGQRVFDVAVNGETVLQRLDVIAQAGGPDRALERAFRTHVSDGQIDIRFSPIVSNPKISAIEITPVP